MQLLPNCGFGCGLDLQFLFETFMVLFFFNYHTNLTVYLTIFVVLNLRYFHIIHQKLGYLKLHHIVWRNHWIYLWVLNLNNFRNNNSQFSWQWLLVIRTTNFFNKSYFIFIISITWNGLIANLMMSLYINIIQYSFSWLTTYIYHISNKFTKKRKSRRNIVNFSNVYLWCWTLTHPLIFIGKKTLTLYDSFDYLHVISNVFICIMKIIKNISKTK